MIISVFYLGVYFGVFGLAANYILNSAFPGSRSPITLFLIPAVWTVLEYVRSSGMFGFGWNLLGYSQSRMLPVIQMADIVGAYGVSFLVVLINTAVFITLQDLGKRERSTRILLLAMLIFIFSLAYGYTRLHAPVKGEALSVAVVQGNIPQRQKWDETFREKIISGYERLTREATEEKVDLVVWPETSVPGYLEAEEDLASRLNRLALDIKTPLLVGSPRAVAISDEDEYKTYNSAYLYGADGAIEARYDKLHLVPFGEFIPFKRLFSFVERFAPMPIGDFSKGEDYTVFTFPIERAARGEDVSWKIRKNVRFSTLICFEDIFPDLTRKFAGKGVDFLVNITNDAWFYRTSAAYQHAQCSVFRAVENRVPVIRAANTGLSCFISSKGRVLASVEKSGEELFVDGYALHSITLERTKTFYTAFGDIFVHMCIAFVCAYAILQIQLRRRM